MGYTERSTQGATATVTPAPSGGTSDDPRVSLALEQYLELCRTGRKPNREAFLERHDSIRGALGECLDGLDFVQAVIGPQALDDDQSGDGAGTATGADPRGTVLGDFRLIREIGRGGMGVVFEAEQTSLGRRVALKVLPFAAALDPRQRQRFQVEAQAAACLHHTHIVPVFAVGCDRGTHYYAMQYIEGRTLADVITEMRAFESLGTAGRPGDSPDRAASEGQTDATGPHPAAAEPDVGSTATALSPASDFSGSRPSGSASLTPGSSSSKRSRAFVRSVARLGVQAADALAHAHSLGILHRDVKPSNLMVDSRGSVWIADFGLARFGEDTNLTRSGDLLGTLRYMSPEQAQARHAIVDQRADIYSLGATLYELLTLTPAFDGRDRSELLKKVLEEDPTPPRRLNPAVPRDLETVLLKTMAKEPAARYATAQDLADDLTRFLDDKPIQARRPTAMAHVGKFAKRHRAVLATALAIAFVAMAGTAGVVCMAERQVRTERDAAIAAGREKDRVLRDRVTLADAMFEAMDTTSMNLMGRMAMAGLLKLADYDKVIAFYDRLSDQSRSDPETTIIGARSDKRAGYLRMVICGPHRSDLEQSGRSFDAEMQLAEDRYRRAIVSFKQVIQANPGVVEHRRELAAVLGEFGNWLWAYNRPREAEPNLEEGIAVASALADEYPGRAEFVLDAVDAELGQAARLKSAGRDKETSPHVGRVVQRAEQCARVITDRSTRASILGEIGARLLARDFRKEALATLEQAVEGGAEPRIAARLAWLLASRPGDQPPADAQRAVTLLKAIALKNLDPPTRVLAAKTEAIAQFRLGALADAADAVDRAREGAPGDDPALHAIEGLVRAAQGRRDDAESRLDAIAAWQKSRGGATSADLRSLKTELETALAAAPGAGE